MKTLLLSIPYVPPASWFVLMTRQEYEIILDQGELYHKGTIRNQCTVVDANGPRKLLVPLRKSKHIHFMKDARISYTENWPKKHFMTLESAYRRSPYFEYYEDRVKEIYFGPRSEKLVHLNIRIIQLAWACWPELEPGAWKVDQSVDLMVESDRIVDMRIGDGNRSAGFVCSFSSYPQVFQDRHGFIPDLSFWDILFNLGPSGANYLKNIHG